MGSSDSSELHRSTRYRELSFLIVKDCENCSKPNKPNPGNIE